MTAALAVAERRDRLSWLVDSVSDLRLIGPMRAAFGVIVILHVRSDLAASRLPVDRFLEPWWAWLPVPASAVHRGLLVAVVVAGGLMIVGVLARLATAVAFTLVLYLLVLDLASFGHNRAFLVWMLFVLTLTPTDRSWSLPAALAGRRGRPRDTIGFWWPVLLGRVIVTGVYLASGGTKLLNPAWRSGLVLWDRTVRFEHAIPEIFDGWVHDLLVSRAFHRVLAPGAILTELAIAVGLWFPRTRRWALALAVVFHVSIELTARVQTFSYSALAALLLWLVPDGRVPSASSAVGRPSTGIPPE